MKKTRKVTLLTILALVCAAVFAACDSGGNTLPKLATPANLSISGTTLTWDAVENAKGYSVKTDGGTPVDVGTATSFSLSQTTEPGVHSVYVKALGDGAGFSDSDWSDAAEFLIETDTAPTFLYETNQDAITITSLQGGSGQPLENLVIPSEIDGKAVIAIGSNAFKDQNKIKSVTLPESLLSIGGSAFSGCGLTSIRIPDSVTSIGKGAFSGCSALEEITVPFTGASINDAENTHFGYIFGTSAGSFTGTVPQALKTVTVTKADGLANSAFALFADCVGLTGITIPDSVTIIGESVFAGCGGLESFTFPSGLKTIGKMAFLSCRALKEISLPDTVTSIGDKAFSMSGLNTVKFSSSLATIGVEAFSSCHGLTKITIPASVTSISGDAFRTCVNLSEIRLERGSSGESITSLGNNALFNCPKLENIYVPEAALSAYKATSDWAKFADKISAAAEE